MSPIIWAVIAVIAFAALLTFSNKRQPAVALPVPARMGRVRVRSQHEVDTDEDLAVIADAYREQRKQERAQVALERLAKITPSTKAK